MLSLIPLWDTEGENSPAVVFRKDLEVIRVSWIFIKLEAHNWAPVISSEGQRPEEVHAYSVSLTTWCSILRRPLAGVAPPPCSRTMCQEAPQYCAVRSQKRVGQGPGKPSLWYYQTTNSCFASRRGCSDFAASMPASPPVSEALSSTLESTKMFSQVALFLEAL